jgi:hypothetical protein
VQWVRHQLHNRPRTVAYRKGRQGLGTLPHFTQPCGCLLFLGRIVSLGTEDVRRDHKPEENVSYEAA